MTYITNYSGKSMYISALMLCVFYAPRVILAAGMTLPNPIQSTTIQVFLLKIIDILLVFALPLIIIYIMYAGYLFVTAQGNPAKVTEARSALLWAVVGGVIVLGAKIIFTIVDNTAKSLQ